METGRWKTEQRRSCIVTATSSSRVFHYLCRAEKINIYIYGNERKFRSVKDRHKTGIFEQFRRSPRRFSQIAALLCQLINVVTIITSVTQHIIFLAT